MKNEIGCATLVGAIIALIAMMFIGPAIELWIWGTVIVPNFAAPALTYWEMFGVNWLCGLLFRRHTDLDLNGD